MLNFGIIFFQGADLSGANLTGANLEGANLKVFSVVPFRNADTICYVAE